MPRREKDTFRWFPPVRSTKWSVLIDNETTKKKYEYYITGEDTNSAIYSSLYRCQTFTVGSVGTNEDFFLDYVRVKLLKAGSPPTLTIELKKTSDGKPTGNVLSSTTYDSSTLGTSSDWVNISFSHYPLKSGIKYALIFRLDTGDASNNVQIKIDNSGATYSGGASGISMDSGTSWAMASGCSMFQIYGVKATDISSYILSAKFPSGLISEELVCEIELDNSGEGYTNKFTYNDTIIFKMDFSDGSTIQFAGEIEEQKRTDSGGLFKLQIKGAHYTSQLLDVMVTEEFTGAQISDIKKNLIDNYLTGFTYSNIETNTTTIDIKFVNKPLLDCLVSLDTIGDEDTYIDNDKDFHSFKRSSKNNDDEAVVWDDSLIELRGLGTDSVDVRNKIKVVGEAGGLPVLFTSEDSGSQTTYRTKEKVITDTSIIDEDQAEAFGDAEKTQLANPLEQGSALCYFMPKLVPGYMTYVIYPPFEVHARYRPVKYVFSVPNEQTEVFFNQERSIPKLFKNRILKEMGQEKIVNPHKMTHSYNFTFDNEDKIDSSASSNYSLSDSKIRRNSGVESATIVSNKKETLSSVSSVHVLAVGEILDGATYWIQANLNEEYKQVSLDTLTSVTSGSDLRLKIIITNANTRIDSIAVLYK